MFGGVVAAGDHAMNARREILFRQLAAITDDGVQRCTQLMADAGEKMCLGAIGRFGLIGRLPQAGHQLGTVGRQNQKAEKQRCGQNWHPLPIRRRRKDNGKGKEIGDRCDTQPAGAVAKPIAEDRPDQDGVNKGHPLRIVQLNGGGHHRIQDNSHKPANPGIHRRETSQHQQGVDTKINAERGDDISR